MKNKIVLISFLLILVIPSRVFAQADTEWRSFESKHCTVLYHPDVDLKKVNNKIKTEPYDAFLSGRFYSPGDLSVERQLADKLESLFQKVKEILDMYPRKIHLTIKIYKDQSQLDNAYFETFNYPNARQLISYYVHKYTTVYTTQQVVSQGVMAHEMGHAVIDHYFLILPPEKIKELLAQYVEIHLND